MIHLKYALSLAACAFVGYYLGLGLARLS